ncbi:Uncharacterised protein [Mycobacteroides abscessus subsp. abscessus]|nr:Uncharacterised protein [Mycobacteroides abscessus subsp. abscessus]
MRDTLSIRNARISAANSSSCSRSRRRSSRGALQRDSRSRDSRVPDMRTSVVAEASHLQIKVHVRYVRPAQATSARTKIGGVGSPYRLRRHYVRHRRTPRPVEVPHFGRFFHCPFGHALPGSRRRTRHLLGGGTSAPGRTWDAAAPSCYGGNGRGSASHRRFPPARCRHAGARVRRQGIRRSPRRHRVLRSDRRPCLRL